MMVPQNRWFLMENPDLKWMIWRYPPFQETPMCREKYLTGCFKISMISMMLKKAYLILIPFQSIHSPNAKSMNLLGSIPFRSGPSSSTRSTPWPTTWLRRPRRRRWCTRDPRWAQSGAIHGVFFIFFWGERGEIHGKRWETSTMLIGNHA